MDHRAEGAAPVRLAGVDVGGTFTDVVLVDTEANRTVVHKVPSTQHDPSEGLARGLVGAGEDIGDLEVLVHGTTIATNALLQHAGAAVGMITTRGFRDVLHIAR